MIDAVVFDLDGVIVDSEQVWDEVRERYARERGGAYGPSAARDMMGMSAPEWSRYMVETVGVPGPPERVVADVLARMLDRYGDEPPLLPGAVEAVRRVGTRWPIAIASSSNPELIEVVLRVAGLAPLVGVAVSSQEVPRGKPAPDVYVEAARRLDVDPARAAAVEDSHNGIRSAKAAGLSVVAIPNAHFPPDDEALALADRVLSSIGDLTVELLESL
ncbi:MAG TPA: HAD family phosphatase [Gaiellaceae bacterium]|nr:HAD family phosphatase [Gaiellaceae bacterium]